jgi:predicted N-acetyltransferase YhbS
MSKLQIRIAEESDNKQILALSERCPQKGMITFYPSRAPHFNRLQRLIDKDAWHFIALSGDRVVGLVGVVHFHGKIQGKSYKIAYMHDLRVDPDFRNGLAAFRLVKTAMDYIKSSDTDLVVVNFLKDNKLPLVFTSERAGMPPAHYLGDNLVYNIIPLKFKKINPRFEIDEARPDDLPEMMEVYNRYCENFKIAPELSAEQFLNFTGNIQGMDFGNFLLARENGKIKAMTAIWDEGPYRTYNVLRLNVPIKVVNSLLRFFNLFMRVPHPIEINKPIMQLSLVMYAHDNCPEALDALFRHANNINLGSDYSFITMYLQENDPMVKYLKKFQGITVKSEMHIFARDTAIFETLKNRTEPVLFDLTMII